MSVKGGTNRSVKSNGFFEESQEQFSEAGVLFTRSRPKFAPFQIGENKFPLDEYRQLSNPSSSAGSDLDDSSSSSDDIQEVDLRELGHEYQSNKASFQDTISNGLKINKDTKFKFDSWYKYEDKEDLIERSFFEEASEFEELKAIFRSRIRNIGEARSDSCDFKAHRDALIPTEKAFKWDRNVLLFDEMSNTVDRKIFQGNNYCSSDIVRSTLKGLPRFKLISAEGFIKGSGEIGLSRLCSKESQTTIRTMRSLSKQKPLGISMVYLMRQQRETLVRVTCKPRIETIFSGSLFS